VRARLVDELPLFMVPTAFVVLHAFPKNAHGKIDRARLPAPEGVVESADSGQVAPRTETERRLAALWQEVLGVGEVGVDDDFFSVGGNSLRFVQIAEHIKEVFGIAVELRVLFTTPTVAGLAEVLDARQPADA
jgi:myxalamid-type nonribosomal peptide synthetase MxaA